MYGVLPSVQLGMDDDPRLLLIKAVIDRDVRALAHEYEESLRPIEGIPSHDQFERMKEAQKGLTERFYGSNDGRKSP